MRVANSISSMISSDSQTRKHQENGDSLPFNQSDCDEMNGKKKSLEK